MSDQTPPMLKVGTKVTLLQMVHVRGIANAPDFDIEAGADCVVIADRVGEFPVLVKHYINQHASFSFWTSRDQIKLITQCQKCHRSQWPHSCHDGREVKAPGDEMKKVYEPHCRCPFCHFTYSVKGIKEIEEDGQTHGDGSPRRDVICNNCGKPVPIGCYYPVDKPSAWTDEPPTEDGYYWVRNPKTGDAIAKLEKGQLHFIDQGTIYNDIYPLFQCEYGSDPTKISFMFKDCQYQKVKEANEVTS